MLKKETFLTMEMKNEFENFHTEKHRNLKPSLDSYMYFPSKEEIIEFDENNPKASNRRIFEGSIQYNYFEETKIRELKEAIDKFNTKQLKNNTPKLYTLKNNELLRFLYSTTFDSPKAIELMISHSEWKKASFPCILTDKVMEILNIGLIYIHGRDCRFRPIINISAKVFEKHKESYSFQEIEMAVIYLLEYVRDFLFIPGQIENWSIVLDLKDVYITSIPNELQNIITLLQINYPCRLFIVYIINFIGNLDFLWSSIKPLLNVNTQRKIKLLKTGNIIELFTFINPMHLEQKVGGKANDMTEIFFPGRVPSNECLLPSEKKSNIILDYDSYKKLLKAKTKIAICPILETLSENNESDADSESDESEKSQIKEEKPNFAINLNEVEQPKFHAVKQKTNLNETGSFIHSISTIRPTDTFFHSFTNNFTSSKNTEKIPDAPVELERKKESHLKYSKSINPNKTTNVTKNFNLRSATFNNIKNDGIVVNLNFSNKNMGENPSIQVGMKNEKLKCTRSFTEGMPNGSNEILIQKMLEKDFKITEESSSKQTCCSLDKNQFSSCAII